MANHHITMIITGSIAAVKSYDLIQLLQAKGMDVSVVLTNAARQWVTPEGAQQITGRPVLTTDDIIQKPDTLSGLLASSDAVLAAPASADFIKQLALQDSNIASVVRGCGKPLVIAPAMNVMMWQHPATQRNSKALLADGVQFLGPVDGKMACGDRGYGRFMEPAAIADGIHSLLEGHTHPSFNAVSETLSANPAMPALDHSLASKTSKKILLMIQDGNDALGTYSLISSLRSRGYDVTCAASDNLLHLLPAEGLATMSNHRAYTHHYQDDVQGMEHIRLPEQADIVMVAPASAEGVKEMAQGGAHSFLGCLYLATKKPVVLVPSCDKDKQPATADLERLKQDGVTILPVPKALHTASKARAEAIADGLDTLIQRKPQERHHAS